MLAVGYWLFPFYHILPATCGSSCFSSGVEGSVSVDGVASTSGFASITGGVSLLIATGSP